MKVTQGKVKASKSAARGGLRKLHGSFTLPPTSALRRFTAEDVDLLQRLQGELFECVFEPMFLAASAEKAIFAAAPRPADYISYDPNATVDLENEFGIFANMRAEVLSADDEKRLFRAFNYARYRVLKIIRQFRNERLTVGAARDLIAWYSKSSDIRGEISRLNISLVLAMARRAKINGVELSELVSEGNLALLRCVDKFDCARGFKFSTYACRAILSAFTRIAAKGSRYRSQFPVAFDTTIERSDFLDRQRADVEQSGLNSLREVLASNRAELSDVEQQVIAARFAISGATQTVHDESSPLVDSAFIEQVVTPKGKTLEEVGAMLGVSKERVRQIQNKALEKLRETLHADYYTDYSLSA